MLSVKFDASKCFKKYIRQLEFEDSVFSREHLLKIEKNFVYTKKKGI